MERLWSLYSRPRNAKKGTKWERVVSTAYPKETAIRVYQSVLISTALNPDANEHRLRPVEGRHVAMPTYQQPKRDDVG